MKSTALFAFLLLSIAFCHGAEKKEHVERQKEEHVQREKEESSEEESEEREELPYKLSERTKEILLHEKGKTNVLLEKALEFFLNNPNRQFERQCFQKFSPGESVDFVIDVASCPSEDTVDRSISESPMALYFDIFGVHSGKRTPSRSYFNAIRTFIDAVTYDMKPEATLSVIYEKGRKYYICGKPIESQVTQALGGEFSDEKRNLETMWPNPTKELPEGLFHPHLKNALGRLTKSALWNRNNGLPTVLAKSRQSKPIYTVVISDGSSGAKIRDLVDDLSRTTVIDIGNRRFVKSLDWNEMRQLVSVVSLSAPQQLGTMVDTCRNLACRFCGCEQE